jgi:hypothetical protein
VRLAFAFVFGLIVIFVMREGIVLPLCTALMLLGLSFSSGSRLRAFGSVQAVWHCFLLIHVLVLDGRLVYFRPPAPLRA